MLSISESGSVLTITLSRDPVNAVDDAWIDAFGDAIAKLGERDDLAVVRIRSGLRTFCAGADLKLMQRSLEGSAGVDAMVSVVQRMQRLFDAIEALPQVTVAEIGGSALGGGFELALSCDLRMASTLAVLGLPEARLGLLPGAGGTQRLLRLCGANVARRLILTAEAVTGDVALELGLVHWAVTPDALARESQALVERIGALSAPALAACKRCLRAALEPGLSGYLIERLETRALYQNPDTRQRVSGFVNRI